MKLVQCTKCNTAYEDKTIRCPKCGHLPFKFIAAGIGIIGIAAFVLNSAWESSKGGYGTPTLHSSPTTAQDEAEFQSVVAKIKALKATTKNPASFELVDAILLKNGALCVVYRGTNSFNAVVTQQTAVLPNLAVGQWNSDCGGKTGKDYVKAKYAL
jgi:hypothetical protein